MEHSAIDGHTMLAYLDYMFQYAKERGKMHFLEKQYYISLLVENFYFLAHEQIPKHAYTPSAVKPLEWKLNAQLREIVFNARVAFSTFAQTLQTEVAEVTEFGEEALRKLSISPDAFVQVRIVANCFCL
jgi:hypothetical protein